MLHITTLTSQNFTLITSRASPVVIMTSNIDVPLTGTYFVSASHVVAGLRRNYSSDEKDPL